ncbi:hypothetical protein [Prevotella sp. HUN102]|uniref:hypothetical protein n=1 Tax=Prevotella sp. HUN102 TaxID=1392486 RepID=UPI00068CD4DE|nr:hypothetical protein [Prevotella sp. HUN102]
MNTIIENEMKSVRDSEVNEKEMQRMCRERMLETVVADFRNLIKRSPEEGLVWKGTKCDLVELCHSVWETQALRNERGVPLGFGAIVNSIFHVLNVVPPKAPAVVYSHLADRKNVRVCSITERYLYLMQHEAVKDPMKLDIKRKRMSRRM